MIAVPLMLALSLLVAAISRALRPSSAWLPAAGMALVLVLWNELPPRFQRPQGGETAAFIGMIRDWALAPGGRLFASPNEHLALTYYSGRPVQSIFPVRRKWLDEFDKDLIILESSSYDPLSAFTVRETAGRMGRTLTGAEAETLGREARLFATQADLQASGVFVANPLRQPDALDQALAEQVRPSTRLAVREFVKGTLYERDAALSTWQDFRVAFFYWFSDRTLRTGPQLNYGACRSTARAILLPNGYTVLDCRTATGPSLLPARPLTQADP
jgi:hypothetical protein